MKPFNVLLTCVSIHVKEMIDCLRYNEEGVPVKVYVTNMSSAGMPPSDISDGCFLVPPVTDDNYISELIRLCKEHEIDIIIPTATLELEIMAIHEKEFEDNGILVSVSPIKGLAIANDKIRLHALYREYMPLQTIPSDRSRAFHFCNDLESKGSSVCCKVSHLCGGKGFAIVDDRKSLDVSLFNKFGEPRYISHSDLFKIVDSGHKVILQENVKGLDYTVSVLCDKGKVIRAVGYVGYVMCFGSIFYGEIKDNDNAYKIAEKIVKDLGLDGNIAFDFILKEDGSAVLLECNPRVNASVAFARYAGCNLIYERCKMMLGEKLEDDYKVTEGLKMKKIYDSRYFV